MRYSLSCKGFATTPPPKARRPGSELRAPAGRLRTVSGRAVNLSHSASTCPQRSFLNFALASLGFYPFVVQTGARNVINNGPYKMFRRYRP